MLLTDVNVLIYAFRRESPNHEAYRQWLRARLRGPEPFAVSELVLSSVMRIVTNHRIYKDPTAPALALSFCNAVRGAPASIPVRPGPGHWRVFAELCAATGARGNAVPDAYVAALAIEQGATWVTLDADFRRFPGLTVAAPFDAG
ncbi:type II toxin-antitoxin system VapC family toxin [Acidiferrimicrobium sp. IK]|uniref:type II toxin-antitoxin system VapC family toxin n=1 Tax=Acidiferrimicrobium sp. IK TaxID=2871700 RepID=UPI0021CB4F29|nr:type II toxin-antitoxin system VapC family toxin [Acidiferrimicrobium sp. IK]MCU4183337.1 type II toxin-antitoxin system VapC family toxin [Acidiferrimicrobium sp. IK]